MYLSNCGRSKNFPALYAERDVLNPSIISGFEMSLLQKNKDAAAAARRLDS